MPSAASARSSKASPSYSNASSKHSSLSRIASKILTELRAQRQERTIQQVVRPYCPHSPSQKQTAFLKLDVEEAFFGGAAAGGKTDALIEAALQYVDVPTYSAALFRLREEDLYVQGAIGDRCKAWFTGTAAKWDGKARAWRFPTYDSNPGAMVHLGYGRTRDEIVTRYQGPEFQYIGMEELGQWQEDAYLYLFSRLRRTSDHVRLRARAAGNPGGEGAVWIVPRFIEHARHVTTGMTVKQYNALRKRKDELPWPPYFKSPPSREAEDLAKQYGRKAQGAYFVPAFAEDNPALIGEKLIEYRLNLAKLDPITRAQLDEGDWWAVPGGDYFEDGFFRYVEMPPAGLQVVRYWDLASTRPSDRNQDPDWTAGVKMGMETLKDGATRFYVLDVVRLRDDPGGVEQAIKATAHADGRCVDIYIEEEPGSAGKNNTANYVTRVLPGFTVRGDRKTGPKEEFWKPVSAQARAGNLYLVIAPWNADFVKELKALPNGSHDDQADGVGGALSKLVGSSYIDALRRATAGTPEVHLL